MRELTEHDFCSSAYGQLQSEGTCGWYIAQSHRRLEKLPWKVRASAKILEVGCNLGEHTPYVAHDYEFYVASDYRHLSFDPLNQRVYFHVADAHALPYRDSTFDRIIVTCVLHHLHDPVRALNELRRVASPGSTISILVPCDPGIAYRAAKKIGPLRKLRSTRGYADARFFHYQQHRNHFPGLISAIERVFVRDHVQRRYWPSRLPTWNLNLFAVFQIQIATK